MSSDAQSWKYETLLGNARLTVAVDAKAWRTSVLSARFEVRLNRVLGGIGADAIRFRYGTLLLQGFEVGSTKAGVDLLRPQWRLQTNGLPAKTFSTTGGACGNLVRGASYTFSSAEWQSLGVFTWQHLTPPGPELVISGPMRPIDRYQGVGGTLC